MRAYVLISVQARKAREVASKITEIAGVKAAHLCWGVPDLIAQVEAENEAALENLVLGQIQAVEGVTGTDTHIALAD